MAMFTKSRPALTDEDSISASRALESDIALLSSAIGEISSSEEASPETLQEAHETDPDIESTAQGAHHVNQPGGGTYSGQLVLDPHSDPADLVRMYQGLKTHLKAEIVSVEYLRQGVTVTCTLQDVVMFLGVLPKLPKINEWSFHLS